MMTIRREDFILNLTAMDWIRSTLASAYVERLKVKDLEAMAEYAETPQDFDAAVNELVRTLNG